MCGRYTLHSSQKTIADYFSASLTFDFHASFNITPTRTIAALIAVDHERLIVPLRWGLIPAWHKPDSKISLMINAKSETIESKPSFRQAFRQRRCLILADGFYEWDPKPTPKQPYYIKMKSHQPFAMAAIWERWVSDENSIDSCCIVTIPANHTLSKIHERMPAIVNPNNYDAWLNPENHEVDALIKLLQHSTAENLLQTYQVSTRVNKAIVDDADCIKPL